MNQPKPVDHHEDAGTGVAKLLSWLRPISAATSIVGTLWIFMIMLLINADVLGRQLFNHPVPGVPEVVAQSIVAIVFLQLSDAQIRGRMIRSDVILSRIFSANKAVGRFLLSLHNLAGASLMGLMCYFTLPRLINAWVNEEYVGTMGTFTFPLWPIAAIIVLASALSSIYYLIFMISPSYAETIELGPETDHEQ